MSALAINEAVSGTSSSQPLPNVITISSKPYHFSFPTDKTALLLIDLQRDFILPDGFGHIQGGDLTHVQAILPACQSILSIWRSLSLPVIHTREGHLPDLSDCPSSKLHRQASAPENNQHFKSIGDKWKMGRLLVRGEYGHDLCEEVTWKLDEKVIDKAGKGSFWNTTLMEDLISLGITHLIVGGVTTECCVTTTVREANDRGFECCIIEEITAGYNPSFKTSSLDMIHWSQGLFGFVSNLQPLLDALSPYVPLPESPAPVLLTPTTSTASSEDTILVEHHPSTDYPITITGLLNAYKSGLSPVTFFKSLYSRILHHQANIEPSVWIHLLPLSTILSRVESLIQTHPDTTNLPPLFCVPFSIKDSYDIAGLPTTVACPPITYIPSTSSTAYLKAIASGAILIGKTNLDQLATGLTGCRSPYGIPRSVFSKSHISGGSSSGSAVSVGARLVSFSLATDTAGSGRVPAGYNEVIGFKPTRGTVSSFGLFPACKSLDCVSVLINSEGGIPDLIKAWNVLRGYDEKDVYAKAHPPILRPVHATPISITPKFRFAIPPPDVLLAHCSPIYRTMFLKSVTTLQSLGGKLTSIPWAPFHEAGELLYSGTLLYERLTILPSKNPREWLDEHFSSLDLSVRTILKTAVDNEQIKPEAIFRDLHKVEELKRFVHENVFRAASQVPDVAEEVEEGIDVLVVPTAPKHPTIKEILEDPVKKNMELGVFTHFGNVLDLCAISVPAGRYLLEEDIPELKKGKQGNEEKGEEIEMPFSVTFLGRSRGDGEILSVVRRVDRTLYKLRG